MKAKERRKPENLPKKRLEVSKLMPSWKEPLDCYFFLCVGCKFIARCLHGHTPKPLDRVGNFFPKHFSPLVSRLFVFDSAISALGGISRAIEIEKNSFLPRLDAYSNWRPLTTHA